MLSAPLDLVPGQHGAPYVVVGIMPEGLSLLNRPIDVRIEGHVGYYAAGMNKHARVTIDGQKRYAACIGGMLAMTNNEARLIATTFEWSDQIDLPRAKDALARAEAALAEPNLSKEDRKLKEAARRRALVRISIAETHNR